MSPDELEILPGVSEACGILRSLGYVLVIVTNQPDVARETQRRQTVEDLNRLVATACGVEHVRVCFHDDPDPDGCRKPQPGLLIDAARDLDIDLARSVMIGDSWRDMEAGRRAGCHTVFVGSELSSSYQAGMRATDLLDAARMLAEEECPRE